MTNKEHYDLLVKSGAKMPSESEYVATLASGLLDALFIPSIPSPKRDPARCEVFGVENEPINWGALRATCEETESGLLVTIEEAAPNQCPTLCDYVQRFLAAWGWEVEVETEW